MRTVKEIAEEINVFPDTVRRWIREGEIKTTIESRKHGHTIADDDFEDFLTRHPKYRNRLKHAEANDESVSKSQEIKHEDQIQITASLDTLIRAIVRDELQKILKSGMGL
jgi:DeoR/GlpR family transcriptional regulator of sugar metabolism